MTTTMTQRKKTSAPQKRELPKYVAEFGRFSAAMLVLGEHAPARMTVSQSVFFILAASADLAGRDPTFTDIRDAVGVQLNRSLHTTYKLFLEPSRQFPDGLGWLTTETNPNDNRQKFLRLTNEGRKVMQSVATALGE